MATILVTGATGNVGREVTAQLVEALGLAGRGDVGPGGREHRSQELIFPGW